MMISDLNIKIEDGLSIDTWKANPKFLSLWTFLCIYIAIGKSSMKYVSSNDASGNDWILSFFLETSYEWRKRMSILLSPLTVSVSN